MIWGRVLASKYFPGKNVLDWIKSSRKSSQNGLICWKSLVEAFPLIGKHLAWNIGNGKQVRLGEDPWVGSGQGHSLPEYLINNLHDRGVYALNDATLPSLDRAGRTKWKSIGFLELDGEEFDRWGEYVASLKSNFILLKEEEEDSFY